MKHILSFIALLAVHVVNPTAAQAVVQTNAAAPDFTLRALDGPNLHLAEQRGRVVLVNFWASWCGPCRQEMPQLNKLHDKYRSAGLVMLGVNIDDDPRSAAELARRYDIRFPVLLDTDKAVVKRYDLGAMPATVLIDRDGRVRQLHRGYREGLELTYDQQIRELIKE
ncbi:MAG: TlpA family protein disulfide reductase [Burkholderiales bacterium]|nr:TlpA family protein disulfide reductase [Burkholderiales bacterium]